MTTPPTPDAGVKECEVCGGSYGYINAETDAHDDVYECVRALTAQLAAAKSDVGASIEAAAREMHRQYSEEFDNPPWENLAPPDHATWLDAARRVLDAARTGAR